ncbi:zinc-dependent metalloprotease [Salana multivorans]
MKDAVDWDLAVRRAGSLAKAGPPVDATGLRALVASLRSSAVDAPAYVADVTGLDAAAATAADGSVLVVDRPRWAEAATGTFRSMAGDELPAPRLPGAARVAGEQLGWVLALLSTRILGQFDPYAAASGASSPPGRLLLVAPNILSVQRHLDADAEDFHLWVCLHEQTHAVQFAAAPWLTDYLRDSFTSILRSQARGANGSANDDDGADVGVDDAPEPELPIDSDGAIGATVSDTGAPDAAAPDAGGNVFQRILSTVTRPGAVPGILEAILPAEQRAVLERSVAVMALLEGHADVVMDAVGPRAIPTVRQIRAGFEKRRDERTLSTLLLRRVLGMDAKLAQYRDGAAFVRGVVAEVGHEGLNRVWEGPDNLPRPEEIADPAAWVARVAGAD